MRLLKEFRFAILLAVWLFAPASARAGSEFANWFVSLPGFSTDQFTTVIQGDQTALIPVQNAGDTLTNPFAFNLTMSPHVTVSLDGSGNTDIVWSGTPIPPGTPFPFPNNEPHFGLNGGGSVPSGGFKILSQTWSESTVPANTMSVPGISANVTGQATGQTQFVILFVQAGGPTGTGEWFEFPLVGNPGQMGHVTVSNNTTAPFQLSNAGFMLSPTQIPLDDLNFNDIPPPGSPGSTFTPLPSLDGQNVPANGGTSTFDVTVPEPTSLVLLGVGHLSILGYWSLRRRRARK
jgi:hypothetical protein